MLIRIFILISTLLIPKFAFAQGIITPVFEPGGAGWPLIEIMGIGILAGLLIMVFMIVNMQTALYYVRVVAIALCGIVAIETIIRFLVKFKELFNI